MSARAGAIVVLGVALVSFRVAQAVVGHDLVGEAHSHATREPAVIGDRAGKGVIDGRIRTSFLLRTRQDRPRHPEYERSGQRWIGLPQPKVAPFAPTVPPTADAAPEPAGMVARRSPGPAFSVFRNTIAGTSSASAVEPSVANDRNGVITTGNWYATVSGDSALTYVPLATNANPVYGGFCCDQVAYAVDRGGHSLVLWLQQYWYSSSADENALRLHLMRGRNDVVAGQDDCTPWDFEPQQDFKLARNLWFDFNQISHTSEFLYITTNVRDATGQSSPSNSPRVGGMIFRIPLDDLDDGNCQIGFRYWYRDGDPYISPVQNAASTMYLATHVPGVLEGDNLRIYSIADSSTAIARKDKDIQNFQDNTGLCFLPDGLSNPCGDNHSGRMTGFRSGSTVGWLWMGDNDGDFPFPHVRVAVFETPSLDKATEHQIWSDDFAWQNPTVGVNAAGHIGGILYAMGGGRFPRAQGFIVTTPRDWSGLEMHSISSSAGGLTGSAQSWGHYAAVRQYGDCAGTFLAATYVTNSGGSQDGRVVWFGDPADACVDLTGRAVTKNGVTTIESKATITLNTTVKNQGSASSPASSLGYYFSSDAEWDTGDVTFGTTRSVNALDPGEQQTLTATVATPGLGFGGERFILACADDPKRIDEITQTNNCVATTRTFTVKGVKAEPNQADLDLATVNVASQTRGLRAKRAFLVRDTVKARLGRIAGASAAQVAYSLSPVAGPDDDEAALTVRTVGKPRLMKGGRSIVTVRRLTLSARVPPGTWYLRGCLRKRTDARGSNNCRVVRRPLTIGGRTDTPGPLRKRGEDG